MITKDNPGAGRLLWWTLALVALGRFATLGLYPLTDTTEARYAEVARKMVELGDWITPWYDYGVPFWAKPPLSTWLTAASLKIFGINEFAARLPYFLLAVFVGWLVWDWTRRRSGREALLAIALLGGTMLYFIASAAVMTDLALVLGTTLAMRGFWTAFEAPDTGRPGEKWLLFIGLGLGMLAKGPIAVVLTGMPIVLWALATGNVAASWKKLPWVKGSLLAVAIALPWYWLAEMRTPGFWEYFFIGEHWKRFTVTGWAGDKYGTAHATARGAIWLLAVAACLPWTLLLPFMAIGRKTAKQRLAPMVATQAAGAPSRPDVLPAPFGSVRAKREWLVYLLAWAASPCLFFTMSGNILWTYVLPALPALAMLAAGWLAGDVRTRRVDRLVSGGVVAMALLVAAYFVNEQVAGSWKTAKFAVAQYQARSAGPVAPALIFLGDLPYSASFYSGGKAKAVAGNAELAARLGQQGAVYVALTRDQVAALTPELKTGLSLEARAGVYDLYTARGQVSGK